MPWPKTSKYNYRAQLVGGLEYVLQYYHAHD